MMATMTIAAMMGRSTSLPPLASLPSAVVGDAPAVALALGAGVRLGTGVGEGAGVALGAGVGLARGGVLGLGVGAATTVNDHSLRSMSPSSADFDVDRTVYVPGASSGRSVMIIRLSSSGSTSPRATTVPAASSSRSELPSAVIASEYVPTISVGVPSTVAPSFGVDVSSSAWATTVVGSTRRANATAARTAHRRGTGNCRIMAGSLRGPSATRPARYESGRAPATSARRRSPDGAASRCSWSCRSGRDASSRSRSGRTSSRSGRWRHSRTRDTHRSARSIEA